MHSKYLAFLLFVFIFSFGYSQSLTNIDILKMDYNYLEEQIKDSLVSDSLKNIYIDTYLIKAKNNKDSVNIGQGYYYKIFKEIYFEGGEDFFNQIMVDREEINRRLNLADSMVLFTKPLDHYKFPGLSYLTRSYIYYIIGNETESLDEAIKAYNSSINQKNKKQINDSSVIINAINDNYRNDIKKRRHILDSTRILFKKDSKYEIDYYIALKNLIYDLQKEKQFELAKQYTLEGIQASINSDYISEYYSFVFSAGINHYFNNNFNAALDSINKAENHINNTSLTLAYYLKGKIYEKKDTEKALVYFNKVDSVFQLNNYPIYGLLDNYKSMLEIYKTNNNYEKQIETIDKLILADSVINLTKLYVNEKILEEYEIPELTKEKEQIIAELEHQNTSKKQKIYLLIGFIVIVCLIGSYLFVKQFKYKKRYQILLQKTKNQKTEPKKELLNDTKNTNSLNIPNSTINEVLSGLEIFEKQNQFTKNTITLN